MLGGATSIAISELRTPTSTTPLAEALALAAGPNATMWHTLSARQYKLNTLTRGRYHAAGLQTHGDSGSSRAVIHQSQLPKSALVMVLEQQLLLISLCLGDLEMAAFYDVKVVALLPLPGHS